MEGYNPRTVDEVFKDFKGRRAGVIKALTTEVGEFYRQCDPEKENLCLYGLPSEDWEVNLPAEEVPPELPEPALGINFARDGMQDKDWLSLVAVYSDSWLQAVAYYFGARFDKNERERLFNLINELPTIFEVVGGSESQKIQQVTDQMEKCTVEDDAPDEEDEDDTPDEEDEDDTPDEEDEDDTPDEEDEDDTPDEEDDEEHGEVCGAYGDPDEF